MMIPEGYEKLAVIGIAYKGSYDPTKEYGMLNAVLYEGSTYVSLRENPQGSPNPDGINWQYLAKGFVNSLLSSIQAEDKSGLLAAPGERVNAQALLDVIADKVANQLLNKNKIVNNLASDDATAVLAAPQGKILKTGVDANTAAVAEVNRKLTADINTRLSNMALFKGQITISSDVAGRIKIPAANIPTKACGVTVTLLNPAGWVEVSVPMLKSGTWNIMLRKQDAHEAIPSTTVTLSYTYFS